MTTAAQDFYAGRHLPDIPPHPPVHAEPYPAPEVTSRDLDKQDRVEVPASVRALRTLAEGAGWNIVQQYSRGCMPHATTGTPGPPRDMFALLMARGDCRATACYRKVSSTWAWESMWAWSPRLIHRRMADLDQLKTWLSRGAVGRTGEKYAAPLGKARGPWNMRLAEGAAYADPVGPDQVIARMGLVACP